MKNHKPPKKASHKSAPVPAPKRLATAPSQRRTPDYASKSATSKAWRLPTGELIFGKHAVLAALANPKRRVKALYATAAEAAALPPSSQPQLVSKEDLNNLLPNAVHQGVVLVADYLPEPSLESVMHSGAPIVVLDQVTDPHNIGAILRSAAVFGAGAVILTERHAPAESAVLAKTASGALEMVPLLRVVNLARTLRILRDENYWCVGLAEEGTADIRTAINGAQKIALVLGAEGAGLRRLTKENCDELARLPSAGAFSTLNVSNAAAVALYEVFRQG